MPTAFRPVSMMTPDTSTRWPVSAGRSRPPVRRTHEPSTIPVGVYGKRTRMSRDVADDQPRQPSHGARRARRCPRRAAVGAVGLPDDAARELEALNLAAVFTNFVQAGIARVVLADAVESRVAFDRLCQAMPGADVAVGRLTAYVETMQRRVRLREPGMLQEQFVARSTALERILADHRKGRAAARGRAPVWGNPARRHQSSGRSATGCTAA